jgi:hypothetical protein
MRLDEGDVLARLARLETENGRLRKAAALVVLGVAALSLTAQDRMERDTFTAQRYQLVDKNGKQRAWFGVNDKDETTLIFYGDDAKSARLALAAEPSGTALVSLCDATGRPRISLVSQANGSAQVGLHDESGQCIAELVSDRNNPAALVLRDAACRDRLRVEVGKDGLPGLSLSDPGGKIVGQLCAEKSSPVALVLRDNAGAERLRAEVGKNGSPGITLDDDAVRPRATLSLGVKGEPLLELLDVRGKTLFKAPGK